MWRSSWTATGAGRRAGGCRASRDTGAAWRRGAKPCAPAPSGVALLMQLFQVALANEVDKLHRNGVRLKVVGDTERFDPAIRRLIEQGEKLTAENRRLTLTIAANYGGRWDILQALSRLLARRP